MGNEGNEKGGGRKNVRGERVFEEAERDGTLVVLRLPTDLKLVIRVALVADFFLEEVGEWGHGFLGVEGVLRSIDSFIHSK